jgi:hypothetical protein
MKLLYYSSYILTAPFYAVSWCFYAAAWSFNFLGDALHDATTYKAWLVLHHRECGKSNTPAHGRDSVP